MRFHHVLDLDTDLFILSFFISPEKFEDFGFAKSARFDDV